MAQKEQDQKNKVNTGTQFDQQKGGSKDLNGNRQQQDMKKTAGSHNDAGNKKQNS